MASKSVSLFLGLSFRELCSIQTVFASVERAKVGVPKDCHDLLLEEHGKNLKHCDR